MTIHDDFDASSANNCATRAFKIALTFGHEYVTGEHLLASLLSEQTIVDALSHLGTDIKEIALDLNAHLAGNKIPKPVTIQDPRRTSALQRVADRAVSQVMFSGRRKMEPSDLLISLLQEENSHAVYFLRKHGVELLNVKQYFSHHESDFEEEDDNEEILRDVQSMSSGNETSAKNKAEKFLRKFCTLLNEQAVSGKVDPLIGRTQEIESLSLILSRRYKNNPIIVGDAGVGKTQIVRGLALKITQKEVPQVLANANIWSLDLGALLSGTKFRGDVEERLKNILKSIEILSESGSQKPILFIDEIHMIMGAGAVSQGSMDISNLLKPALSSGELRCIGSTTYDEYRKHFEKDRALMRRFQRIDVLEPSIEDTKRIVEGLSSAYAKFHGVNYDLEALHAAVDLTSRYITDRVQPDKSLDIIDTAGARLRLMSEQTANSNVVTTELIEVEVAKLARIPALTLQQNENEKLFNLERDLHAIVFDQAEAIEQLTNAIYMSRAGLREPNKPLGNYLFRGTSGTGKTEVCKQLAKTLGIELVRFDMSEYMEKHSVSKLIGAPPGYVGFGDGQSGSGLLINAIEKHPHCVLLLDEVEKAAPEVFNILLQVMDDGRLTSGSGKTVNFTNVILIMTSNVGASELDQEPIGFNRLLRDGEDDKSLNAMFSPEFRNRLDAVIKFKRLQPSTMIKVVEKFLDQLNSLLHDKGVKLNASTEAKEWLSIKGYDPKYGARPLSRVIQEHIKKPLSREMLFGKLKSGGIVYVTLDGDHLQLSAEELEVKTTVNI